CASEMRTLAPTAAELGIAVIGGGHCHERVTEKVNGVTLIESGADMQAYARAELSFDMESEKVVSSAASIHDNTNGPPDPQIAAIVADWQAQADAQLSQVIGYVEQPISRNSAPMHNMVTDSWLVSFPSASVSVTNRGGIRQDIPAGDITLGTMVGVLPFENVILELDLTGNQLLSFIENSSLVVGGMTTIGGYTLSNGQPIVVDSTYKVLTTDYLYAVTNNLALYDPAPYNTAVNYRQPVIDWIRSLNTSTTNPLDRYLDTVARQ
ncbi:MAG: 5'-nucleotidase C-terminal domain-containing protein, partial [bacterium]